MRVPKKAVSPILAVAVLAVVPVLSGHAAGTEPVSARLASADAATVYTTPLTDPSATTGSQIENSNWNGYLATGNSAAASFTQVDADFNVPSVNCAVTANGYVSHWAGLDGAGYDLAASTTLEAVGVTALCSNGTASYYAWWETYPDPQVNAMSVSPGDAIDADVHYMPSSDPETPYYLDVTDLTTGQGFTKTEACAATACPNSSAEVVTSAPADAASTEAADLLTLADYGQVNYVHTGIEDDATQFGGFSSSDWTSHLMYTPAEAAWLLEGATGTLYGGGAFFNLYPTALEP
jgi:hypothetical protein